MAIETKLAIFKDKYSLTDAAIEELKSIFDSVIVEFTHKIINSSPVKTVPKLDTSRVIYTEKRFATRIADEYASECNVTLEEIPSETGKVTKKDVEKYVKSKTGVKSKKSKNHPDGNNSVSKPKITSKTDVETEAETDNETKEHKTYNKKTKSKTDVETEAETDTEPKKIVSKKENKSMVKEKCNGITKDGNPCNLNATKNPDGSKKCYCFRHAIDWKQYEVSSDSDYESEDKKIQEDIEIVESD